eukprot:gnl/Trimastix_PCT/1046.p1 GENE.gnl/Trimastix_PCT/1046~~gnl/Trimastix_PCT/1046.p1  ORF type:complete len:168 (-),score=51.17 gnl/Trimastix_PCT/1046:261-764(-)
MNTQAALIIRRQLSDLTKKPVEGISVGLQDDSDLFRWQVCIMGPPDTIYEGGMFQGTLTFPENFPNYPPEMRFTSEMWHPNIYPDGRVCISILHPPGDDEYGYEDSSERWRPINSIEAVLLSVIAMLSEPNDDSPANIDAAVMWRNQREEFKRRVARTVRVSQESFF